MDESNIGKLFYDTRREFLFLLDDSVGEEELNQVQIDLNIPDKVINKVRDETFVARTVAINGEHFITPYIQYVNSGYVEEFCKELSCKDYGGVMSIVKNMLLYIHDKHKQEYDEKNNIGRK